MFYPNETLRVGREQGITYKTVWKWYKASKLPVRSEQMPTGIIAIYPEAVSERTKVTIYTRVSSADQKEDTARQVTRLKDFASANGWTVASVVDESGSGLKRAPQEAPETLERAVRWGHPGGAPGPAGALRMRVHRGRAPVTGKEHNSGGRH